MRVHILTGNCESVFQFLFIDAQNLFEEASEENCVTCLVDQLRGGEDAHLFVRHSYYIRAKGIGHTRLTLEKSRSTIHAHIAFVLRHSFPLFAVSTKIYILHAPLLALPTIIQLAIGRQVNQSLVDDM